MIGIGAEILVLGQLINGETAADERIVGRVFNPGFILFGARSLEGIAVVISAAGGFKDSL